MKNKIGSSKLKKYQDGSEVKKPNMALFGNKKAIKKAVSEGNSNNPPLVAKYPGYSRTTDTTGYSSGKTTFPLVTKRNGPDFKGVLHLNNREGVQRDLKTSEKAKQSESTKSKTVLKKGGSVPFGMLSVKAGVDKNPKPTAADRIAGAKMKKGGSVKAKKK